MSFVIPVKASIEGGTRTPGLTRLLHSSTTTPPSRSTMPTSMMRWCTAMPPVVSRSTQATRPRSAGAARARGDGSGRGLTRSELSRPVERQDRSVEIGPAVAEHAPGVTLGAHRVEVESGGEDRLAGAVGLRDLRARGVGDERRSVEGHLVLLAALDADAVRGHQRHDVRGGVSLHAALPVVARVDGRVVR